MSKTFLYLLVLFLLICQLSCSRSVRTAEERLLRPGGIKDNPIKYEQQNVMRIENYGNPDGPLGTCRVYSNVSVPTYFIYQPKPEKNTGVGMVVLPGGGYEDIWLDTEGHEIGMYFSELGITCLVVKYRTNTKGKDGKQQMSQDEYLPAAVADAKEGIRILRSKAKELKLDPEKIGVGGFSAGGHLSLSVCFNQDQTDKESRPDFAFLIYPWIEEGFEEKAAKCENLPPMFIVNGQEDTVTPPDVCAHFYYTLCKNNVPAEMHIYSKGEHGFTLGLGKGYSTVQWKSNLMAWLKDIGMIGVD